MQKSLVRKGLVVVIIFLFVGASIIPSTVGINEEKQSPNENKTSFMDFNFRGNVLYVGGSGPSNYSTIQAAINAANSGDTVYVYDDSSPYYENVVVNKAIDLIGENEDTTTIDGSGSDDVVAFWHDSASSASISHFTLRNGGNGIRVVYADGTSIFDCNIFNCNPCIHIQETSTYNTVSNCEINAGSSSNDGIVLAVSSSNNDISNCDISNCNRGIYVAVSSSNNVISDCHISDNNNGIRLFYSSNNNIVSRCVFSSNDYGVYIYFTNYPSNSNKIYHNNFMFNQQNAYDECNNIWDDGYPSGGNYWDDYTGEDGDGDGIGDTAYNISGGSNQDRYPLMEPWSGGNQPPTAEIYSIFPNPAEIGEVIFFEASVSDPNNDNIAEYVWRSDLDGKLSNSKDFNTSLSQGLHRIEFLARDQNGLWSNTVKRQIWVVDGVIYRPTEAVGGNEYWIEENPNDGLGFHEKDAYANKDNGAVAASTASMFLLGYASATAKLGINYYFNSPMTKDIKITSGINSVGGAVGGSHSYFKLQHKNLDVGVNYGSINPSASIPIDEIDYFSFIVQAICFYAGILFPASWAVLILTSIINAVDAWRTVSDYQDIVNKLQLNEDIENHFVTLETCAWAGNNHIIASLQANSPWLAGGNATRIGQIPYFVIEEIDRSKDYSPYEAELSFYGLGPVNITLYDPNGGLLNLTHSEILGSKSGAIDINDDGTIDNHFFIPNAINGSYTISVLPKDWADENATFSLIANYERNETVIVENNTIGNLTKNNFYYFNSYSVNPPYIELIYPTRFESLNETILIEWNASDFEDELNLPISIYYSNDFGENWSTIDTDLTNDGEQNWNTTDVPDGSYILKIETNDSDGNVRYDTSGDFIIHNYDKPIASFNYSTLNPTNLIQFTSFSNDSDGAIVNWTWNLGDGNISYDENPIHQYTPVGNYTVCLMVTDDDGATDSISKNITVLDGTPPEISNVIDFPDPQGHGSYVNISAIVIDNIEVADVNLYLLYPDMTEENFSLTQNKTGYIYYCNRTYEQFGIHTYHIWASDTSSNANTSSDYTFRIINQPPYPPNNPDPFDGEIDVDVDADLSWTGGDPDGDSVTYDVYFGTTSPPPKVEDNQSDTFYNPSGDLEYNTMYYWQIVAWDNHGAYTEGPIWGFTTKGEAQPDLYCEGELQWTDVEPGETVTGSFTVENIGDPTSLLDWEIESYPDWGTWTFDPDGGLDLTPEDGAVTVNVEVVAPEEPETEFTGEVVVVNTEDPDDYCIVDVSLFTMELDEPELEIEITGGFGAHVVIRNIGDADAYDVEWRVNITGGLLGRIDKRTEGNIEILPADGEIVVDIPLIIGLGRIEIAATAGASNAETVSETKNGFIIVIFVVLQ